MIFTKYEKFLENQNNSDMWNIIPQSVKDLHQLFQANGKKLYVVGGAVRDFLTGDTPKDFDLATDALPDEVLSILGKKFRTNLQGKAFGVVVVYTHDQPAGMEIATFRQDVSKGRNPEVKLGVSISDDVKRRDLTYNALFYDLDTKEIVDLVGGVKDLKTQITRMVGDAAERIDEDSLRILRAFRFASRYMTPLDVALSQAIENRKSKYPDRLVNINPETGKIERISQERIWEEIKKAFKQAKSFTSYLAFFSHFEMWDEIFPGSNINEKISETNSFVCYMANLFVNENVDGLERKMVQNYKIEIETARQALFLIKLLNLKPENAIDLYKEKVRCHISDDMILEWLRLKNLNDSIFRVFLSYKPSVDSTELMAQGFKGKELGDEIKKRELENFMSLLNK